MECVRALSCAPVPFPSYNPPVMPDLANVESWPACLRGCLLRVLAKYTASRPTDVVINRLPLRRSADVRGPAEQRTGHGGPRAP
eukprot:scaffold14854_cov129-Isochrysis_galbana.AAC.2